MISVRDFYESLISLNGVNSIKEIEDIVNDRNKNIKVNITKISLEKCNGWVLDDSGVIHNESNSFFQIKGIEYSLNNKPIVKQPIIIQNEIGYLGIIVKKINGILHFLMQAKIEPGNINKVQISPTIQATKSNFEQKHGGKKPAYLEYFLNSNKYNVSNISSEIENNISSLYGRINIFYSYVEKETDREKLLEVFKNILKNESDLLNIFYADTIPYKDGGTVLNTVGQLPNDYDQTSRE